MKSCLDDEISGGVLIVLISVIMAIALIIILSIDALWDHDYYKSMPTVTINGKHSECYINTRTNILSCKLPDKEDKL